MTDTTSVLQCRLRFLASGRDKSYSEVLTEAADALARLEREVANEQARGIHSCGPGCTRDGCVRARLEAENAELRQDAERYRHLRNQTFAPGACAVHGSVWVVMRYAPKGQIPDLCSAGFGAELDASVDAARQEKG